MTHRVKIHCNVRECKAACCNSVVMDKGYFSAYRKRIVTPIIYFEDMGDNNVLAMTSADIKSNKCPFLTENYQCNIYEVRPTVCRKFAVNTDESKYLRCKFLGQVYNEEDESTDTDRE